MTHVEAVKKMRAGHATVGRWLQIPGAGVAEIMGWSGYDWVVVDAVFLHSASGCPRVKAAESSMETT